MKDNDKVITDARGRTIDRDRWSGDSAGQTSDSANPSSGDTAGTALGDAHPHCTDAVRFQDSVVLSKGEVFGACQALADADRLLLKGGGRREASALGDLFDLLEARLVH